MTFSWENASRQEIVFALQLLIGLSFSAWSLWDILLDLYRLWKRNGNIREGDRRILRITMIGNLRSEIARLFPQILFLILVLFALQMPTRTRREVAQLTPEQLLRLRWAYT